MPRFTYSAHQFLVCCSTAAVLLLTTGGCRNAQSAYQFRPAPTGTVPTQPPATGTQQLLAETTVAPAPTTGEVVAPPARSGVVRSNKLSESKAPPPAPRRRVRLVPAAARPVYAAVVRPVRRNAAATDGAQATTEVGLGTTVLGVLGLIVGPISLIGLLIWGGPVWATLLGLSALAVLVAYIDPFR